MPLLPQPAAALSLQLPRLPLLPLQGPPAAGHLRRVLPRPEPACQCRAGGGRAAHGRGGHAARGEPWRQRAFTGVACGAACCRMHAAVPCELALPLPQPSRTPTAAEQCRSLCPLPAASPPRQYKRELVAGVLRGLRLLSSTQRLTMPQWHGVLNFMYHAGGGPCAAAGRGAGWGRRARQGHAPGAPAPALINACSPPALRILLGCPHCCAEPCWTRSARRRSESAWRGGSC